jgi:hypothetical protein
MTQTTNYPSDYSYNDIFTFNQAAGNLRECKDTSEFVQKVFRQLDLIKEELNETYAGAHGVPDFTELLDGCCDLLVVVTGLQQILEANGFDVQGAMKATNENNLSKFCRTPPDVYDTFDYYEKRGIQCTAVHDDISGYIVVKNKETGKVLKKVGFKSNDVSPFVSDKFKERF